MNRFFRSALFPLVIIAALVWLALQTLGNHGNPQTAIQTSQFIQAVHDVKLSPDRSPSQVSDVVIELEDDRRSDADGVAIVDVECAAD